MKDNPVESSVRQSNMHFICQIICCVLDVLEKDV